MPHDSLSHNPPDPDTQNLRPTYAEIDLRALTHNYKTIQNTAGGRKVMVILKANAYGHGLIRIAQHMETLGAPYFGVAYLEEALILREAGITTPILVMGGIVGDQIPLFLQHDITITVSSTDKLKQVEDASTALGKKALVHLKIDTGMERIGVHYYNADKLLEASLTCKNIEIEGLFSHFANADSSDLTHARLQLERFETVLSFYKKHDIPRPIIHMANSGAVMTLMPDALYDMVRPGIMLYGISPNPDMPLPLPVKPVMSWKTHIVYFKVVKPGHPVSYGSSWQTDKETRVITLPVGYGDGYFRSMSNTAEVLVHGKRYPLVGHICMDQMMADIGKDSAYNGEEVTLLGTNGDETIRVEDLSRWAGTIPHEILTNINTRVPRRYKN